MKMNRARNREYLKVLFQMIELIGSFYPDGIQISFLKIEEESFLLSRKGTRSAEKKNPIIENMGESHCFEPATDPVRGGFCLQDSLEGMCLEHGIRVAVTVAEKGIIFHVEEKYPCVWREMLVDETVHWVLRQRSG